MPDLTPDTAARVEQVIRAAAIGEDGAVRDELVELADALYRRERAGEPIGWIPIRRHAAGRLVALTQPIRDSAEEAEWDRKHCGDSNAILAVLYPATTQKPTP